VFVTAHEHYAVQAFEHGAIDYVVKPFEEARLADSVTRLKSRLAAPQAAAGGLRGGARAAGRGAEGARRRRAGRKYLQWIRASVASSVRLIPVEQIAFLRSDEKYTLVAWEGGEALIRTPIRELAEELDPDTFAQIHRSVIVNLRQVAQVDGVQRHRRGPAEESARGPAGQPQLPARLPADVSGGARRALTRRAGSRWRGCRRRPSPPRAGR
jgi:DNA-binding LytR/AlgR family response regulator